MEAASLASLLLKQLRYCRLLAVVERQLGYDAGRLFQYQGGRHAALRHPFIA